MKKGLFSLIVVASVLFLLLAACSSGATTSSTTGSSASSNSTQTLSSAAQLLVGTLKLEGTDKAVDAKQAADLLPLWQAYSQLINSDSAAQAEIDAVVVQIQSTMTTNQIQAINAMKLTQKDMMSTMGSLGFNPSASGTVGASTPQASSSSGFAAGFVAGAGGPPSGGAAPAGGFPAGGDPGGAFGGATTDRTSSTQVASAQTSTNTIHAILINALIELLQKRAGS